MQDNRHDAEVRSHKQAIYRWASVHALKTLAAETTKLYTDPELPTLSGDYGGAGQAAGSMRAACPNASGSLPCHR